MKVCSRTLHKTFLLRKFGQANLPNMPENLITVKVLNEPYKGDYAYGGYNTRPPMSGTSVLETTPKGNVSLSNEQTIELIDPEVLEETVKTVDEMSGSKKHPQSQYDSSHPNEKSDPNTAFYDPKLYNIEEMDYILGPEEKNIEENRQFKSPQVAQELHERNMSAPKQNETEEGSRNKLFGYNEPGQGQHSGAEQSQRNVQP